jgi:hypothetical protein
MAERISLPAHLKPTLLGSTDSPGGGAEIHHFHSRDIDDLTSNNSEWYSNNLANLFHCITHFFHLWLLLIYFKICLCTQNTKVLIHFILGFFPSNTKNIWSMLFAVGWKHLCWASLVEGGGRGIIPAYFFQLTWIMLPWARCLKSDRRHMIPCSYFPILFYPSLQVHCLWYIIYKIVLSQSFWEY